MADISPRVLLAFLAVASLNADQKKLTLDQRVEILRGLTSEFATVKVPLPRSRKPLDVKTDGSYDKQEWTEIGKQLGPAARIGDLVQVTHLEIEKDSIILQINGGMRAKGGWKDHVSVGMGGGTNPINGGQPTNAPGGTTVALRFGEPIGEITSAEVKKMLSPVLDFNQQSATQQYTETIPPEVKKAIEDKRVMVGMDRDQVIMAIGKPVRKSRETHDGVENEDWIYGNPPGRMTFVTFTGAKVSKVKETYAGLGGTVAETPRQQ
jgi:hypothetical protein